MHIPSHRVTRDFKVGEWNPVTIDTGFHRLPGGDALPPAATR